jgi:hypothetical protein
LRQPAQQHLSRTSDQHCPLTIDEEDVSCRILRPPICARRQVSDDALDVLARRAEQVCGLVVGLRIAAALDDLDDRDVLAQDGVELEQRIEMRACEAVDDEDLPARRRLHGADRGQVACAAGVSAEAWPVRR